MPEAADSHDLIEVRGARENNLRDVSLDVPKRRLTVFTGVSGSGKSSLVFGTIAAESQRLINETYTAFLQSFMPSQARPDVDSLRNLSAAIIVDQERMGANTRSTVGTATDAYSMLRIIFSRLGEPHVGASNMFSFNDPAGMCMTCEGIGRVSTVDVDGLVDRDLSLDDGAITFPNFAVDSWYWQVFARSGYFDTSKKLRDYTDSEWEQFLRGPQAKLKIENLNLTYEGLIDKRFLPEVLEHRLRGKDVSEVLGLSVLAAHEYFTESAVLAVVDRLADVGLGYLTLGQPLNTLSGGERQRLKLATQLGGSTTTYVLDEPTSGLHMADVDQLVGLLDRMVDDGNTVVVIEHNLDVVARADWVIDLGPGAGHDGGTIVFEGTPSDLTRASTLTGQHLAHHLQPTGVPA